MPIFFHKKRGTRLLWTTRFGQAHSFLVLPLGRRIRPSLFDFRGDFSAVLKFTGQQYKTIVRKKHERVFLRTVVLLVASALYAQIQVAVHHGIDNNV